jgi:pimeloyl-ACP methyl ester carboxylesterase
MITDISFNVDGQKLIGTLYKAEDEQASVLIIAGGGNNPRNESHYPLWQAYFADQGITTFNFDFRGVGESGAELKDTSLNTRVEDAKAALRILKENSLIDNVYVIGTSMGAPVAIQIVDDSIQGLLLIVPAAYSFDARDKKFGLDFSESIRKPESWRDSPDFEDLQKYRGNTFLLYAPHDEVIPVGISSEYERIVHFKNGTIVASEGAGHKSWTQSQTDFAIHAMAQFIT